MFVCISWRHCRASLMTISVSTHWDQCPMFVCILWQHCGASPASRVAGREIPAAASAGLVSPHHPPSSSTIWYNLQSYQIYLRNSESYWGLVLWHYIDQPGSPNNVLRPKQKAEVLICWWGCLAGQYYGMWPAVRFSISYIILFLVKQSYLISNQCAVKSEW